MREGYGYWGDEKLQEYCLLQHESKSILRVEGGIQVGGSWLSPIALAPNSDFQLIFQQLILTINGTLADMKF